MRICGTAVLLRIFLTKSPVAIVKATVITINNRSALIWKTLPLYCFNWECYKRAINVSPRDNERNWEKDRNKSCCNLPMLSSFANYRETICGEKLAQVRSTVTTLAPDCWFLPHSRALGWQPSPALRRFCISRGAKFSIRSTTVTRPTTTPICSTIQQTQRLANPWPQHYVLAESP